MSNFTVKNGKYNPSDRNFLFDIILPNIPHCPNSLASNLNVLDYFGIETKSYLVLIVVLGHGHPTDRKDYSSCVNSITLPFLGNFGSDFSQARLNASDLISVVPLHEEDVNLKVPGSLVLLKNYIENEFWTPSTVDSGFNNGDLKTFIKDEISQPIEVSAPSNESAAFLSYEPLAVGKGGILRPGSIE